MGISWLSADFSPEFVDIVPRVTFCAAAFLAVTVAVVGFLLSVVSVLLDELVA